MPTQVTGAAAEAANSAVQVYSFALKQIKQASGANKEALLALTRFTQRRRIEGAYEAKEEDDFRIPPSTRRRRSRPNSNAINLRTAFVNGMLDDTASDTPDNPSDIRLIVLDIKRTYDLREQKRWKEVEDALSDLSFKPLAFDSLLRLTPKTQHEQVEEDVKERTDKTEPPEQKAVKKERRAVRGGGLLRGLFAGSVSTPDVLSNRVARERQERAEPKQAYQAEKAFNWTAYFDRLKEQQEPQQARQASAASGGGFLSSAADFLGDFIGFGGKKAAAAGAGGAAAKGAGKFSRYLGGGASSIMKTVGKALAPLALGYSVFDNINRGSKGESFLGDGSIMGALFDSRASNYAAAGLAGAAIGSVVPFFGTIIGGIVGVAAAMVADFWDDISEAANSAIQWVADGGSKIKDILSAGWDKVLDASNKLWTSASASFQEAKEWAYGTWGRGMARVRAMMKDITDWFGRNIDSILEFIKNPLPILGKALEKVKNTVAVAAVEAYKKASGLVETAYDAGRAGGQYIRGKVGEASDAVKGAVSTATGYVGDKATSAYNSVKDWIKGDSKSPTGAAAPQAPPAPAPGDNVVENQGAATRNLAIQPWLKDTLERAAEQTGVKVSVNSGGQPTAAEGGARVGSDRHDKGNAADLTLHVKDQNGNWRALDTRNPQDAAIMAQFVTAAVEGGATGVGAEYSGMGNQTLHIGGGSEASWGGSKWMESARQEGVRRREAFNAKGGMKAWKEARVQSGKADYTMLQAAVNNDLDTAPSQPHDHSHDGHTHYPGDGHPHAEQGNPPIVNIEAQKEILDKAAAGQVQETRADGTTARMLGIGRKRNQSSAAETPTPTSPPAAESNASATTPDAKPTAGSTYQAKPAAGFTRTENSQSLTRTAPLGLPAVAPPDLGIPQPDEMTGTAQVMNSSAPEAVAASDVTQSPAYVATHGTGEIKPDNSAGTEATMTPREKDTPATEPPGAPNLQGPDYDAGFEYPVITTGRAGRAGVMAVE